MKKVLAWLLILVMVVGMFAGCRKDDEVPTTAPSEPIDTTAPAVDTGLEDAIAYLKAWYKSAEGTETPVDFERFGTIRIAGVPYEVVWSVDVSEDLIKIVKNEDGTVTIDVNEECEEDTPYVLTATITDGNGKTVSASWNHILPKAADMLAIVEAAYALKPGESLPYASTLRGKVIAINTIYSEEYKNITVTIEVPGAEGKPIECYRLKGDGIKDIAVGNIITVTGTLKNYNGKIEFDAGCIMDAWDKGEAVETPTDPGVILKSAYSLADGKTLPYVATLTGTVVDIPSPYDPNYGNISVTIQVEGYPQYPMLCYRMKGADIDKIAINDLITVSGIIKNYKGTIEYDSGCQMIKRVSGGGVAQGPSSDPVKILADATKLQPGQQLQYRATLTGEIVTLDQAYSAQYGNVTVTIKVNGVKIQCYRMKGNGADQIRVTDTITVSGIIKNYNGKLEFDTGCTLDSWKMGPRVETINYGPLSTDTAYIMAMAQNSIGKNLYFNGKASGNYLATSEDVANAVEVYMEKHEGKGVRFYFMDGETKTYINIIPRPTDAAKTYPSLSAEATCYFKYDDEAKVYAVENQGTKFYLGTYGTYETISTSSTYYITGGNASTVGVSQFVATFIAAGTELPEQGDTPDTPVTPPAAEAVKPEVGNAYKFGMIQESVSTTDIYYLKGGMDSFYMASTSNVSAALDVYLEPTTGGYYLYTFVGGAKTYINMVTSTGSDGKVHVNGEYSATASTVYTYNEDMQTVVADINDGTYRFGTRNDKTYTTIGPVDVTKGNYYCKFYLATGEEGGDTPDTPDVPTSDELTIKEAIDLGLSMAHNTYTTEKYKVTGVITEVYQEVYGNMRITDEAGNILTIYGTYSADGSTRYDALSVKPVAGDTVTIYGIVGQYNNVAQIKNGWIIAHTPAGSTPDTPDTPDVPADDELTIKEAIDMGLGMAHNTYTEEKYKVTGVITEVYQEVYGNMRITDEAGNILTIYGTYSADGSTRYDALSVKPVAGDTVTIYGIVGQYNNVAQIKNGWIIAHTPAGSTPDTPDTPDTPVVGESATITFDDTAKRTSVSDTQQVWQENGITFTNDKAASTTAVNANYFNPVRCYQNSSIKIEYTGMTKLVFTCGDSTYAQNLVNSISGATATADGNVVTVILPAAANVFEVPNLVKQVRISSITVSAGEGGNGGSTTPDTPDTPDTPASDELTISEALALGAAQASNAYTAEKYKVTGVITEVYNETYGNMKIADDAGNILTIYGTYSADGSTRYDAMTVKPVAGDTVTIYGIVGNYNGTPQIKNGWIVAHTAAGSAPETPDDSEDEDVSVDTSAPVKPTVGNAYKFGMIQESVSTTDVYFLKGGMDSYYMASTKDGKAAIDVYLQPTTGGYYLYTFVGGAKTYINMVTSTGSDGKVHVNGEYSATASTVYTYDEDMQTVVTDINDGTYRFGTRNDKTYTTIGPVDVTKGNFYCKFYAIVLGEEGGEEGGETPDAPAGAEALTIADALVLGVQQGESAYTTEKYLLTGKVVSITGTTYGNLYIQDENGDSILIYGTYSADGSVRFDALEVQPKVGDTITVLGVIGNYLGTPQMKNGWLIEHVIGEAEEEPSGQSLSIAFDNLANRTEGDTSKQVWVVNGVTVTNLKAASTTNVNLNYSNPIRCYQNSSLEVAYNGMTKLIFTCSDSTYAQNLANSISGATVSVTANMVTVELPAAANSFFVGNLVKQVRISSIEIFYN